MCVYICRTQHKVVRRKSKIMVKKAYLYSKNNKLHRAYEEHSLLSIFSKNLIVLGSNLFHKIRHKLKGSNTTEYISDVSAVFEKTKGNWNKSEASTLASSANINPEHK